MWASSLVLLKVHVNATFLRSFLFEHKFLGDSPDAFDEQSQPFLCNPWTPPDQTARAFWTFLDASDRT